MIKEVKEKASTVQIEKNRIQELSKHLDEDKSVLLHTSDEMAAADKIANELLNADRPQKAGMINQNKIFNNFEKIKESQDINDILDDLKKCNPNYQMGKEWRINCQRCVPTMEMRRRGYDVTALPRHDACDKNDLAYNPFDVWENPEVIKCSENGIADIEKLMKSWGDGARAQIVVVWKNTNSGHTFCAEQINGKTVFYDPQTGSSDVTSYFKRVEPNSVSLCRIDNQDITDRILDCCRKV